MGNIIRYCVIVLFVTVFLGSTLNLVEGKSKGTNDRPPGWDKGEKKGWKGDIPPGLVKKHGKKQKHEDLPEDRDDNNQDDKKEHGTDKDNDDGGKDESGHDDDDTEKSEELDENDKENEDEVKNETVKETRKKEKSDD